MSKHCDIVETTGCAQNGDIGQAMAEALERAKSLLELGADHHSTGGGFSGISSHGGVLAEWVHL